MELRALAEQILRSDSLQEKLADPGVTSDERPGSPWTGPKWPGRPKALRLDLDRPKAPFPSLGQLHDPIARGQVLHFFANHELLAMELMALALVRFPDAPPVFRKGIAHTLKEEQDHLRRYLARMEQLGVAFGELHNSPFFWTSLSPMDQPIHYCAGLSLAFEQANLDYCLHYGRAFAKVGDLQTSELMDHVYQDEIGHVRHGLRWYRTFKDQSLRDWDAFEAALLAPLTPARAKGKPYDREGRRRAGFDADWIDALQVYGRTKGRPPTLWWFNPGCEQTLLGQLPSKPVQALRRDLGALPMFLSRRDDTVIAPIAPSSEWLQGWQELGVDLPEWVPGASDLAGRKLGHFVPFGPGPEADRHAAGATPPQWTQADFRKSSALELQKIARQRHPDLAGGEETQGRRVLSIEQLVDALSEIQSPALVKQDLGSSGQGQRRVASTLDAATQKWAQRILTTQGALVVEPLLDRVSDLSALYHGDKLLGLSRPLVDKMGVWRGQVLSEPWAALPVEVRRLLSEGRRVLKLYQDLADQAPHSGYWNIDGLVYRDPRNTLRLRAVVERNPRMTMGHIARGIARWIRHGRPAVWTLHHRRDLGPLIAFSDQLRERFPALVEQGQLVSGVRFTNDPTQAQDFLSVVWVGAHACEGAAEFAPILKGL